MMRILKGVIVLTLAAFSVSASLAEDTEPVNYYGRIGKRLSKMLPRYHVLQHSFDDEISARAWSNLVTFLDVDHSVFLQSDLDGFKSKEKRLDDLLSDGNVKFGYDVYNRYLMRLRERIDFATNYLASVSNAYKNVTGDFELDREHAEWPGNKAEAEARWQARLNNELLGISISEELDKEDKASDSEDKVSDSEKEAEDEISESSPAEKLIKKYRQYLMVFSENDPETVLQYYLSAVCRAYDPHSDYLSPLTKEDFDMEMNLSLCGVGAVLHQDDGALKIVEIMPGGPVDRDGRIKTGDKIIGVRQGDGEMEDIMWQPMRKTIRKIRGEKGTRVTLKIVSRSDAAGVSSKLIELVRDEIKLEDQAFTGRVEVVTRNGREYKLGYVNIPSFYGSMDKNPGEKGYRSCAMDVADYIAKFNNLGVEALALDFRGNGGGSLREAVMLSALFVPSGPVVYIRDTRQIGALPIPGNNPVAFKKPMIVLTDRASASASEIVAGHLKDVGRALVVGDALTHGKGTVQTVMGVGPEKYGSMKVTTARFYRVDGRSTQVKGVECDIHLPSLLDSLDIGEDKLPNALAFSRINTPVPEQCWNMGKYVRELSEKSLKRTSTDERFQKHLKQVLGMKEIADRKHVPLAYGPRKELMKHDRILHKLDDEEQTYSRRKKTKDDDCVLDEAFLILSDLVDMVGGEEMKVSIGISDWANIIFGM